MTIIDRIFQKVAELSIPHFFITVEFPAIGNEMPERIETFLWEKYRAILRGASGRKFVYTEGEWRLIFTFFPTNKVQSPNQKIPDRKTKCVIKTHINIKQNVIFGAKLKPV